MFVCDIMSSPPVWLAWQVTEKNNKMSVVVLHYAKSYRPFELFVNENYKL